MKTNTGLRMAPLELVNIDPARFYKIDIPPLTIDGLAFPPSRIGDDDFLFAAKAPAKIFQVRLTAPSLFGHRQQLAFVAGCHGGATVRVEVNQQHFASLKLPASSGGTIDLVSAMPKKSQQTDAGMNEITAAVEKGAHIDVVVTFEMNHVGDNVYLLLGKGSTSHGTRILTIPDSGYSRNALLFFYGLWALVIGVTVLWYCFQQSKSRITGAAPFSAALLYYLVTTFVPRESWKQWAPGEMIRRLHGRIRADFRRIAAVLVTLSAVFVLVSGGVVLAAVFTKLAYISLVETSLAPNEKDFSKIVEAFDRIPWRRDAFLAYELRSKALKASLATQEQWRSLTQNLVMDRRIEHLVNSDDRHDIRARVLKWLLFSPEREGIVEQDPIIALAHIMAEAEPKSSVDFEKQAIVLLREKRPDNQRAKLLMLYLEYDLAAFRDEKGRPVWPRTAGEVIRSLEAAVDQYMKEGNSPTNQEYVQAVDLIGYFHLASGAQGCDRAALNTAISRFAEVLQLRLQGESYPSRTTWRSPGKLRVFQLWRFFQANGKAGLDPIWGQYFGEYRAIYAACPRVKNKLEELFKNNDLSQSSQLDKWTSGTAFDEKGYRQFILDEIQRGWRL